MNLQAFETSVTITLKEITDLLGVEHNKAMKKVEQLTLEPSFGQVAKIASSYFKGNGAEGNIGTYHIDILDEVFANITKIA